MIIAKLRRDPWILLMLAMDFLLLGVLLGSLIHPLRAQLSPARAIDLPSMTGSALVDTGQVTGSLSDRYAQLIEQPIFHQDRKYTPPPKVDHTVAQTPPPDFMVTGFLGIPGRPGKAFLRERTGSRMLTVSVGDSVDGWSVVSVDARQVNLHQGERSVDLIRGGAPVAATVTAAPGTTAAEPAVPVSGKIGTSAAEVRQPVPSAVPPASTDGAPQGMLPPSAVAPMQSQSRSAGAPVVAEKTPQAKFIGPVVPLQGVSVSPQQSSHFTSSDLGPLQPVSPQGPLLTYKPPPAAGGN